MTTARIDHWASKHVDDRNRPWDILLLGGKVMPGIPTVDVELPGGLDVRKPRKGRGAQIVDEGAPPVIIHVKLQINDRAELAEFKALLPMLRPRSKSAQREPVSIDHPNPNFFDVVNVVVSDIRAGMPNAKDGWIVELKLIEWTPTVKTAPALTKKPVDDSEAWAPFGGHPASEDAPSKTAAPMTNLFSGAGSH